MLFASFRYSISDQLVFGAFLALMTVESLAAVLLSPLGLLLLSSLSFFAMLEFWSVAEESIAANAVGLAVDCVDAPRRNVASVNSSHIFARFFILCKSFFIQCQSFKSIG